MLESLYGAFDKIALRRRVFKVETIGDCYNAVTGLPKPQKNHAIIMARFAGDIREKANSIFRDAELTLGPGTGDLMLRIGLHSGAVTGKLTCSQLVLLLSHHLTLMLKWQYSTLYRFSPVMQPGVLRGEKAKFELFGDTINMASRMKANSLPNRIHCSQKTADQIAASGKDAWLTRNDAHINARGQSKIQVSRCPMGAAILCQISQVLTNITSLALLLPADLLGRAKQDCINIL